MNADLQKRLEFLSNYRNELLQASQNTEVEILYYKFSTALALCHYLFSKLLQSKKNYKSDIQEVAVAILRLYASALLLPDEDGSNLLTKDKIHQCFIERDYFNRLVNYLSNIDSHRHDWQWIIDNSEEISKVIRFRYLLLMVLAPLYRVFRISLKEDNNFSKMVESMLSMTDGLYEGELSGVPESIIKDLYRTGLGDYVQEEKEVVGHYLDIYAEMALETNKVITKKYPDKDFSEFLKDQFILELKSMSSYIEILHQNEFILQPFCINEQFKNIEIEATRNILESELNKDIVEWVNSNLNQFDIHATQLTGPESASELQEGQEPFSRTSGASANTSEGTEANGNIDGLETLSHKDEDNNRPSPVFIDSVSPQINAGHDDISSEEYNISLDGKHFTTKRKHLPFPDIFRKIDGVRRKQPLIELHTFIGDKLTANGQQIDLGAFYILFGYVQDIKHDTYCPPYTWNGSRTEFHYLTLLLYKDVGKHDKLMNQLISDGGKDTTKWSTNRSNSKKMLDVGTNSTAKSYRDKLNEIAEIHNKNITIHSGN